MRSFLRIISILIAIVGTTLLFPAMAALFCGEEQVLPAFLLPMFGSWIVAAFVFGIFQTKPIRLSVRSVFVVVAGAWIGSSLFGAIPLLMSGSVHSLADAVFESVSGFTTTGASVIDNVEGLPRSINLWRCQMHWLGGMGVVALTVALMPLLGVGGFQLIKAETTGPEKGKVTPKIATTAKALWLIYVALTIVQTLLLRLAGMDFLDAVSYSFATLGTGGFATRNLSVAAYHSASIDWICTVFMVLAAANFSMYFYLIRGRFREIRANSELKAYLAIYLFSSLAVTIILLPDYGSFENSARYAAFQVASIMSTTGFATADYTKWPAAAQFVLFLMFFIGGCSGSTAGGVKVVRWVVLGKQAGNEMDRMIHPHGVFAIRLDGRAGRKDIVFSVAAFGMVYAALVMATTFIGTCGELDLWSAFTGALSIVGNVGPAFGRLGPIYTYSFLPDFVKWSYSFAMLAGRLELYTMIIFFERAYWKR